MNVLINVDELSGYGDVEALGIAAQAFDLQARCEEVLKARRADKLKELRGRHERLIVERRAHGKTLEALRTERGQLQFDDQELDRLESKAAFELRLLRGQKPNPVLALAGEIEEYGRKVAALEQELGKIHKRQFDHNAIMSTWTQQAEAGNEKLARLDGEVQSLWDQIRFLETGVRAKRHDAVTGLWMA